MVHKIADLSKLAPYARETMMHLFEMLGWEVRVLNTIPDTSMEPAMVEVSFYSNPWNWSPDVWYLLEGCDLV